MTQKIHKYLLSEPTTRLKFPPYTKILSVANQDDAIVLYVMEDLDDTRWVDVLTFYVVATGEAPPSHTSFLGTVNIQNGTYMFHIFVSLGK